ncbi:hypothetical protein [Nocardioides yefusunii]|uniref:Uncharacterized protein n=1 Tax=Nocardioides yefusunii TaxID=2500546 RepID=A0ABW1QW48_9ACTN|nr:hypothetical protein [Nocardioides yefusunii]
MRYLDLPDTTRLSLLRGYLERSWRRPGVHGTWVAEHDQACDTEVCDSRAYEDGQRLRAALDAVIAAITFEELNVAEIAYDELAAELDARWGDGMVVRTSEGAELGFRGFRGDGFSTASHLLVGEARVG